MKLDGISRWVRATLMEAHPQPDAFGFALTWNQIDSILSKDSKIIKYKERNRK